MRGPLWFPLAGCGPGDHQSQILDKSADALFTATSSLAVSINAVFALTASGHFPDLGSQEGYRVK
jgi:hypothetical protein